MYSRYAELRDKQGLSDYAVSKKIGLSRSILSDWKIGKHTPSNKNLKKIADFFNVSLDYLAGRTKTFNITPVIKAVEKAIPASDPAFTDDELLIIAAYRNADDVDKRAVKRILQIEDDNKKGVSIS